MEISNNKTSHLVSTELPDFVRDDHSTFVEFIENYYKFMEQEGGVTNINKNLLAMKDPDLADGIYLQKLYDNFISLLPNNIIADKTLILKHVKDFYRSRGSEKSIRFLLRILLNKEVSFYYPKKDILKASDGKWFIEKSVRINNVSVSNAANSIAYTNFVSKTINGANSGATAVVETVDVYYDKGELITELKLSNIYRTFNDGEQIWCMFTENGTDKFLSASLFSGIVSSVSIINGGAGYLEGSLVPVEGGGGSGAQIIVSKTTKGYLTSTGVIYGGTGYQVNDQVIVSGGGGSGATVNVFTVDSSGTYHPNSYNIISSIINLEANTPVGNSIYSNLQSSISDPANAWISNSMSSWLYANCGPITSCLVITPGNNYISSPLLSVSGNTLIRSIGILGRLEIIDGGADYVVGDTIEFINPLDSYGFGAYANVISVNGTGSITNVRFQSLSGLPPGGAGYSGVSLPRANVISNTGHGANISVTSIVGEGASIISSASAFGQIQELKILSGGSGYTSPPTLNLQNMSAGSGGIAEAFIVTGAYTYPGRYINDDGFLSSYNFLEDRDYYQNYSYVIRVNESLNKYRKAIKDLIHPAGMKLFGEFVFIDNNVASISMNVLPITSNSQMKMSTYYVHMSDAIKTGSYNVHTLDASYAPYILQGTYNIKPNTQSTYTSSGSYLKVLYANNTLQKGQTVHLRFDHGLYSNVTNGAYVISGSTSTYFMVPIVNGNSAFVQLAANQSNLSISTGSGANVSVANLSQLTVNSNVSIEIGDTLNVRGNLVTVVYLSNSSNSITVSPALRGNITANLFSVIKAPFTAFGNVAVFDPTISISVYGSELSAGQNTYLKFSSSDTTLANDSYQIGSGNTNYIKVAHRDIVNATSFTGEVNVNMKTITVSYENHGRSNNEVVYLNFYSGDTGNAVSDLYVVSGATQNTFNVLASNSVVTGGSVRIRTNNITATISSHEFTSNDNVAIWAISGDTANVANGWYIVGVADINTINFTTDNIPTSNGNISVYRNYANVTINRTNHGLILGHNIGAVFDTGNLSNIANGVFKINRVANTNTYNILHQHITISSNLNNLLANNSGIVYITSR